MSKSEPLILCEMCHSYACEAGMVETMRTHRATCKGKPEKLRIVKKQTSPTPAEEAVDEWFGGQNE